MKAQDILLGIVGICIIVVYGTAYATINYILFGKAFPND